MCAGESGRILVRAIVEVLWACLEESEGGNKGESGSSVDYLLTDMDVGGQIIQDVIRECTLRGMD
ncbi:hypothetical protein Ocin01_19677 [Orchesella cincta]|uniref:Uncharacterized protein n=1 Tax=Orchesella cincta TaxID=48709 RepID=A0A1D2M206_ORCCI|nr:hypothetical protein Ocin01_19677 [Orchesella cincta]